MNSDIPAGPPKRRPTLIRVAIALVVVAILALPVMVKKHDALIGICKLAPGDPQDALAACDFLLKWTAYEPSARSLIHRHKMRVYMAQQDWDSAEREVDLAVAEAPENPETLRDKYRLLVGLEKHAAVDEFVSEKLRTDGDLDWLPSAAEPELFRLLRNPALYPKIQAVFLEDTLDLRDQLAASPADDDLRWKFLVHCRVAPTSCPPLYPERRESYPNVSCDQAIADFDAREPGFMVYVQRKGGPNELRDLVANEPERATMLIQAHYVAITVVFELEATPETAERLLINTHMFDCVSGGEFLLPEQHKIRGFEPTNPKKDADILFSPELRRNLVDMAYAVQN